ncbi:MAG: bifunctional acetate--CoA ligase family protein/GNAT family N-acetyltransferase [Gammaproteobacteria bacterium]
MGPHYLSRLFSPESIAVIGASERPDSVGMRVLVNLREAEYQGAVYPVNPKHKRVLEQRCYPDVASINKPVDLAVIATPAPTVPKIIHQCGEAGVRAVVVISAGFGEVGEQGHQLQEALIEGARRYGMRVLGPNCLGIMRPEIGLNATFSKNRAHPGHLALVSQSGALCTAVLDWAEQNDIGFSAIVSLGDAADLDFGDVLDYLALDPDTRSILLYIEGVLDARGFISGLRAAARLKPVIVIKAGRHAAGTRAAVSHTGALIGADDVFDAALERTGAVRAASVAQLFAAAEILTVNKPVRHNRLAIVTNGGGPGVMASDRASEMGVALPDPSKNSIEALNALLPKHWSHGNPIDILGDAPPDRYGRAVKACLDDPAYDGVVAMLSPQAMTEPTEAAQAVVDAAKDHRKPVLACWLGEAQVADARALFAEHHIPSFSTPEDSIEAFSFLSNYHHNQALLRQVPPPLHGHAAPDIEGARLIIESALSESRSLLSTTETRAILSAFHIPILPAIQAKDANDALIAAEALGFPVALKIDSPDLTHKSDVGGVRLNIGNAPAVRGAYQALMENVQRRAPDARVHGVTVEHMYESAQARELFIGVMRDPVFGPTISFGLGGTAIEVHRDRAVALPPLNTFIIRSMIGRTRVARMLGEFRQLPAINMGALESVLERISEMVCELPHIKELDINPLMADDQGVMAVDARIVVELPARHHDRYDHIAIHPYPSHLVSRWQLPDGTEIVLRPIRPEDAGIEQTFVKELSDESRYFRFMQALHELTPEMLVRFTQIDYSREMAFIAVTEIDGREVELGVARYTINPDRASCEFALVVLDSWHHRGIGTHLMEKLMQVARARSLQTMEGEVLSNNRNMLELVHSLGFTSRPSPDDPQIQIVSARL